MAWHKSKENLKIIGKVGSSNVCDQSSYSHEQSKDRGKDSADMAASAFRNLNDNIYGLSQAHKDLTVKIIVVV